MHSRIVCLKKLMKCFCICIISTKHPPKNVELEEIIHDLKGCLEFDEGGVRPIRSCGTHWISHKVNVMKRVVSKFGAYTNHLASLSEDKLVKSGDRAKLKGFYK